MPDFELNVGPKHDERTLSISLTENLNQIAVMVSGGLDSAALYYIIKKINLDNNLGKTITPIIIYREEGSKTHAENVVKYVDNVLNDLSRSIKIFDFKNKVQPHLEVIIAGYLAKKQFDTIYIGVIETRPEHALGITVYSPKENDNLIYPFRHLEKSHIVDLICKLNQTKLFSLTISCDTGTHCGYCNGCKERSWAFETMKVKDYKI